MSQRHSFTENTLDTLTEGLCHLRRSLSSIRRKKKKPPPSLLVTDSSNTQNTHKPLRAVRSNPTATVRYDNLR
ncbi:hypothetical protein ACF0H5_022193 [Mactra antiquata]